jgi:hypothetical protein
MIMRLSQSVPKNHGKEVNHCLTLSLPNAILREKGVITMKRKTLLVTILLMLALLVIAFPATANNPKTVGEQINLFYGPDEFPAGAPFHIQHGWFGMRPWDDPTPVGIYGFELEIDGIYRKPDYIWTGYNAEYDLIPRVSVYNFPDGMNGIHTFTGYWIATCKDAVEAGIIPGPCRTPNEKTIVRTESLTVSFVP